MTRRHVLKGLVFTLLLHLLFKKLLLAAGGKHDAPFSPEVTRASWLSSVGLPAPWASHASPGHAHRSYLAFSCERAAGTAGRPLLGPQLCSRHCLTLTQSLLPLHEDRACASELCEGHVGAYTQLYHEPFSQRYPLHHHRSSGRMHLTLAWPWWHVLPLRDGSAGGQHKGHLLFFLHSGNTDCITSNRHVSPPCAEKNRHFFYITGRLLAQGHLSVPSHTFILDLLYTTGTSQKLFIFPWICGMEQMAFSQSWRHF